jgi:hypothetical protein
MQIIVTAHNDEAQRVNIKCCLKIGKTATETFQLIKEAYADSTLSLSYMGF